MTRPERPVDLAELEERIETGPFRQHEREFLLGLVRDHPPKSGEAARKADGVAQLVFYYEAVNPGVARKVVIADVLKAYHLSPKSRSYVYKVLEELERTDPERVTHVKAGAAAFASARRDSMSVEALDRSKRPLK